MPAAPAHPQTTEPHGHWATGPCGPLYAWLAENDIREILPTDGTIMVNPVVGAITYPSFTWLDDKRGFNGEYILDVDIEPRIMRLLVPLTDAARASAKATREAGLGNVRIVEL